MTKKRRPRRKAPAKGKYRSGFEAKVAASLDRQGVVYDYETVDVAYIKDVRNGICEACESPDVGQRSVYKPDFIVTNGIFIEAKGKFDSRGRSKILAVLRSNNQITRENFRMLFMRDNYTTSKKRETYMDWCERHDILCALGPEVPEEWLQ